MKLTNINEEFLNLKKDSESDIEVFTVFESKMNFIIAELKPLNILPPHYHNFGTEVYHVLSGEGISSSK